MKNSYSFKHLVLFCISIVSLSLQAQNVGIGTTNPQEKLDIQGAIKIGTDIVNDTIAPVGGAGTIRFRAGKFEGWNGSEWISLGDTSLFHLNGNDVRLDTNIVDIGTTNFIFGSTQMDDDNVQAHESRMFFNKSMSAFRAGNAHGNQWDSAQVGELSTAFGKNTVASGKLSFALGRRSTASGLLSFAAGEDVVASGEFSLAMGDKAYATNFASVAVGYSSYATGYGSVALGWETRSLSPLETTISFYPTVVPPRDTFQNINPFDRLFTIGNGSFFSRSDALVILKNGNMGLGNSLPPEKLMVDGCIDNRYR
jgi:hypothetical protein